MSESDTNTTEEAIEDSWDVEPEPKTFRTKIREWIWWKGWTIKDTKEFLLLMGMGIGSIIDGIVSIVTLNMVVPAFCYKMAGFLCAHRCKRDRT